jgi:hypothetical protein
VRDTIRKENRRKLRLHKTVSQVNNGKYRVHGTIAQDIVAGTDYILLLYKKILECLCTQGPQSLKGNLEYICTFVHCTFEQYLNMYKYRTHDADTFRK